MLLSVILLFSFIFGGVFCGDNVKVCTIELAQVVYQPETCAFKYFTEITDKLRFQAELFWSSDAKSLLTAFSERYKVEVLVADAFGMVYDYPNAKFVYPFNIGVFFLIQRLTTVNGAIIDQGKTYAFATKFWSKNGQLLYLIVSAPRTRFVSNC